MRNSISKPTTEDKELDWKLNVIRTFRPNAVKQVVCSSNALLVLLASGEILTWIANAKEPHLLEIVDKSSNSKVKEVVFVEQIAAGSDHFAARTNEPNRNLFTWGSNEKGQLGYEAKYKSEPTRVEAIFDRVVEVACGGAFTLVQTERGEVLGFGSNEKGQLGLRSTDMNETQETAATMEGEEEEAVEHVSSFNSFSSFNSQLIDPVEPWSVRTGQKGDLDTKHRTTPVLIHSLGRGARKKQSVEEKDNSIGYEHLHLSAFDEVAVGFTSVEPIRNHATAANTNALSRLKRLLQDRRGQVADAKRRLERMTAKWSLEDGTKSKLYDLPSGCNASAELVDLNELEAQKTTDRSGRGFHSFATYLYPGMQRKWDGRVVRDPALQQLQKREDTAKDQLDEANSKINDLKQQKDTAQAALCDIEAEMATLIEEQEKVRTVLANLKSSQEERDRSFEIHSSKTDGAEGENILEEMISVRESQLRECTYSRQAIGHRKVHCLRTISDLEKETLQAESTAHAVETRLALYQRLRLRRQRILQFEYTANMKALWDTAALTIHKVWQEHVVPADVFVLVQQWRDSCNESEGLLEDSISSLVEKSNALLENASWEADKAIEELRESYARLEVPPTLVGRAGPPPSDLEWPQMLNSQLQKLCTLNVNAPLISYRSLAGMNKNIHHFAKRHLSDPKGVRKQPIGAEATADNVSTFHHALLMLFKVQFSAVVGDEVMIGSVSITLDGKGTANGNVSSESAPESSRANNMITQELTAVIYQDLDGAPTSMLRDGYSRKFRIPLDEEQINVDIFFPSPVPVFVQSTRRGMGSCWVGLYSDKPCGIVNLYGRRSVNFDHVQAHDPWENSSLHAMSQPQALLICLPAMESLGISSIPPMSVDLIPEQFKIRSPVHIFIRANVLTTCDRCKLIIMDTIEERKRINMMLLSVKAPRKIIDVAASARALGRQAAKDLNNDETF